MARVGNGFGDLAKKRRKARLLRVRTGRLFLKALWWARRASVLWRLPGTAAMGGRPWAARHNPISFG